MLFTGILFLRDAPFINLYFINKVWIIYLIALFIILLPSGTKKLFNLVFVFLLLSLAFTIFSYPSISEALGVVIYFLFWIIVSREIMSLIRRES